MTIIKLIKDTPNKPREVIKIHADITEANHELNLLAYKFLNNNHDLYFIKNGFYAGDTRYYLTGKI